MKGNPKYFNNKTFLIIKILFFLSSYVLVVLNTYIYTYIYIYIIYFQTLKYNIGYNSDVILRYDSCDQDGKLFDANT